MHFCFYLYRGYDKDGDQNSINSGCYGNLRMLFVFKIQLFYQVRSFTYTTRRFYLNYSLANYKWHTLLSVLNPRYFDNFIQHPTFALPCESLAATLPLFSVLVCSLACFCFKFLAVCKYSKITNFLETLHN